MTLYSHRRSTTSFRPRAALDLKDALQSMEAVELVANIGAAQFDAKGAR